jgi:RsiW-degrading membrane proteinase PrsW (M82 family)
MGPIIAATFATVLALGGFILLLVRSGNWRAVALAFVIALPLQPVALIFVRLPIDRALKMVFGVPTWVVILSLFYAPLTEEPAKWLAAAVPALRRAIMSEPVTIALAVGLGFGIGEIWLIAYSLLQLPGIASLPATDLGPFVIERLEVCFLHGAFVALPFVCLARGRPFWLGGLAGMTLHFLLNFPIYLKQIDAFGLGEQIWVSLLLLWMVGFIIACALMTWWLAHPRQPSASAAPASRDAAR